MVPSTEAVPKIVPLHSSLSPSSKLTSLPATQLPTTIPFTFIDSAPIVEALLPSLNDSAENVVSITPERVSVRNGVWIPSERTSR